MPLALHASHLGSPHLCIHRPQAPKVFGRSLSHKWVPQGAVQRAREGSRGSSYDADRFDELLAHASPFITARYEDRPALASRCYGSSRHPLYIGELRRAGGVPHGHRPVTS